MLTFYGIRFNKQGTPERFNISFELRESLNAGLYIYECLCQDIEKTIQAIEREINNLFRGSRSAKTSNKLFRLNVAKWFRTRDIIQFACPKKPDVSDYRLKIARILNTPETIEDKWLAIEAIILEYLNELSPKEKDSVLTNPESDLNYTLQMIKLFFMEQDEEMPPANLEMQFVRNQFPKVIWKKKDGFSASSNPFWIPKNPFCSDSYLLTRLFSAASGAENGALPMTPSADHLANLAPELENPAMTNGFSLRHLYPEADPDEIRIEFEKAADEEDQLTFLPETAAETLLSLQKAVQRQYSHEGVKHLLAIFRQIAMNAEGSICELDVEEHLRLVTRVSREGNCSEKQYSIFWGVFGLLRKLKVRRFWRGQSEEKQVSNPFILDLGEETRPNRERMPKLKLLLDPIFSPSKRNPYQLGRHLSLIPDTLFRESVQKHPLVLGIASFLTGSWLNSFSREKGTVQLSTKELVEGGAFNVTSANKYRVPAKIDSELAYLREKCYISDYTVIKDTAGNPWGDRHRVSAPNRVIEAIEGLTRMAANQTSERLIA